MERRLGWGKGTLNGIFRGKIELKLRHLFGILDVLGYTTARWITADDAARLQAFVEEQEHNLARDAHRDLVYLAESTFWLERVQKKWPETRFHATREHT